MVESACKAGDLCLTPGWGRAPAEGNCNQLQYSCLENSMNRGAWWPIVHGVTELDMTERLTHTHGMFGRTNAFCFKNPCLRKTLRQVNNPGILLTCQHKNSFWGACKEGPAFGFLREKGCQEPTDFQLHLKMESSARPVCQIISNLNDNQSILKEVNAEQTTAEAPSFRSLPPSHCFQSPLVFSGPHISVDPEILHPSATWPQAPSWGPWCRISVLGPVGLTIKVLLPSGGWGGGPFTSPWK